MKETNGENNIQKPIWIIGISLIIFLLLLAGSLVILKISRDGLNKVAEKGDIITETNTRKSDNYIVLADGTKLIKNEEVLNAVEEIEGMVVKNFEIEEKDGVSYIKAEIINNSGESIVDSRISLKIFDANGNQIEDGTSNIPELKPNQSTIITITSYKDNLFLLEGITNYQDISLNSDVLTTGYGVFPSDILIGKVTKIEENKYNTSKLLYVESNVNFNEINYVSILGNNL